MAKRRRVTRRDLHRWWQVRLRAWCARGDGHEVIPGTWMRTRRDDYRQLHSCEACLAKEGIHRPERSFTSSASTDAPDVHAKRLGDDL